MKIITSSLHLIYFLSIFVTATESLAAELRVGFKGSYEDKIIDLEDGQTGVVEVNLKSSGRDLKDYQIGLIRYYDSRIMMTIDSDPVGIVRFMNVPAERYVVRILRIPEEGLLDYVEIGDVALDLYESEDKENSKDEAQ